MGRLPGQGAGPSGTDRPVRRGVAYAVRLAFWLDGGGLALIVLGTPWAAIPAGALALTAAAVCGACASTSR